MYRNQAQESIKERELRCKLVYLKSM